jgi:beta-galactosidase
MRCKDSLQSTVQNGYQPGKLIAISHDNTGREIRIKTPHTASAEDVLTIKAEQIGIRANGKGLAYINIAITDIDCNIQVERENRVTVEVKGAGTLAAFGSSSFRTEESYVQTTQSPFEGRALAIVRTG